MEKSEVQAKLKEFFMSKKQKGVLVVAVIAMLLIFGGVTYAFFTSNITNTNNILTF